MHKYRVIENPNGDGRIALQSGSGRCHLARALGGSPTVGAIVYGTRPHLGFGILLGSSSAQSYRVIFETINSTHVGVAPLWAVGPVGPGRTPLESAHTTGP